MLAPVETLVGFGLLTAGITWVLSIYPALSHRRSLAQGVAILREAEAESGIDAVEADPGAAERTLRDLTSRLVAVRGSLLQFSVTYYFHTDDERSSPRRCPTWRDLPKGPAPRTSRRRYDSPPPSCGAPSTTSPARSDRASSTSPRPRQERPSAGLADLSGTTGIGLLQVTGRFWMPGKVKGRSLCWTQALRRRWESARTVRRGRSDLAVRVGPRPAPAALPFPGASFDGVVGTTPSPRHRPDPARARRDPRVPKPGGEPGSTTPRAHRLCAAGLRSHASRARVLRGRWQAFSVRSAMPQTALSFAGYSPGQRALQAIGREEGFGDGE